MIFSFNPLCGSKMRRSFEVESGRANQSEVQKYWEDQRCAWYPNFCRQNIQFCQCTWGILISIGVLLTVILVPLSFKDVEYDQYALKRNTLTNKVDVDTVYENGRRFWGVNFEAVTFPRQYQEVRETVDVFPDNGLEFQINLILFYRVQFENIGQIFKSFGTVFDNHVRARINAKIKNQAPVFSLQDYIEHRPTVTRQLHTGLVQELTAIWMDLPFDKFFLTTVTIPPDIVEKDLEAAIQQQKNVEEQNRQREIVVRKETTQLVEAVQANITLINATAHASAVRVQKEAEAVAEKTLASADGLGMKDLFVQINVSDIALKEKYVAYFAFLDSRSA